MRAVRMRDWEIWLKHGSVGFILEWAKKVNEIITNRHVRCPEAAKRLTKK